MAKPDWIEKELGALDEGQKRNQLRVYRSSRRPRASQLNVMQQR